MHSQPSILAINVGNSRTAVGIFSAAGLDEVHRLRTGDTGEIADLVAGCWSQTPDDSGRAIVVASVDDEMAARIVERIEAMTGATVLWVVRDVAIPIRTRLDPESIVGMDRLLNAAAAFDALKQACVVIDAGTAVTVDFVDGSGTFQGGAIALGARLQLEALAAGTNLLPEVTFAAPEGDPFGTNTQQAMLHGVYYGIRGMVRYLVERYAESYQAYPQIVATGGDAHLLFDDDDLVESIIDDLTLKGIEVSVRKALEGSEISLES